MPRAPAHTKDVKMLRKTEGYLRLIVANDAIFASGKFSGSFRPALWSADFALVCLVKLFV